MTLTELIAYFEAEFPQLDWLVRSNKDDERQRSAYFVHLHSPDINFNEAGLTFPVFAATVEEAFEMALAQCRTFHQRNAN
jgi:hypothetical protein